MLTPQPASGRRGNLTAAISARPWLPGNAGALALWGLAAFGLLLGGAVYLERGLSSLYLFQFLAGPQAGAPTDASLLHRQALGSLPSLTHAFAFSLITGLLLERSVSAAWRACLLWALIGTVFECLQAAHGCPPVLAQMQAGIVQLGCAFVSYGHFDGFDLAATWLGAALAWSMLVRNVTIQRKGVQE